MSAIGRMGFVGYTRFLPVNSGSAINIRVTSADLKLTQTVEPVSVVDSKIDSTVWQIGPQVVGGGISFPLLHELPASQRTQQNVGVNHLTCGDPNTSASLAQTIWQYATLRDNYGRLDPSSIFNCAIRYADNIGYQYNGCLIDTLGMTFTHEAIVTCNATIVGGAGNPANLRQDLVAGTGVGSGNTDDLNLLAPVRAITWNDTGVSVYDGDQRNSQSAPLVDPTSIREFAVNVNNNIDRIYSLNGQLAPVDIVAKKRMISGTLRFLGAQYYLTQYTQNNQNRFSSSASIAFGFRLGAGSNYYWATGLFGVIFTPEEVALGNELFETNTTWTALGDCANDNLATVLGTSVTPDGNGVLPVPIGNTNGSGSNYGASTAPTYPSFDTYSGS